MISALRWISHDRAQDKPVLVHVGAFWLRSMSPNGVKPQWVEAGKVCLFLNIAYIDADILII